jgi:hypothetical protein
MRYLLYPENCLNNSISKWKLSGVLSHRKLHLKALTNFLHRIASNNTSNSITNTPSLDSIHKLCQFSTKIYPQPSNSKFQVLLWQYSPKIRKRANSPKS